MTLHIIKLCVGVSEVPELVDWQEKRLRQTKRVYHVTRMQPKRAAEVLDGGSLYWIIRGLTTVRQRIIAIEPFRDDDGIDRCKLVFDPALVLVKPQPRRAFQGWRYLEPADAPPDLRRGKGSSDLPPKLRAELAELGLL
jgi:hypothetical protein